MSTEHSESSVVKQTLPRRSVREVRDGLPPKKKKLSVEDKIKMAGLVKDRPCLWKQSYPMYRKHIVVREAWIDVAVEVGLEVRHCKTAWRSLRNSFIYHKRIGKVSPQSEGYNKDEAGPEGNGTSESFDKDGEPQRSHTAKNWKLWDSLRFIEDDVQTSEKSSLAKRHQEPQAQPLESEADESDEDGEEMMDFDFEFPDADPIGGVYDYDKDDRKPRLDICQPSMSSSAPSCFDNEPVQKRIICNIPAAATGSEASPREIVSGGMVTSTVLESSQTSSQALKYDSMYVNLDRMLQKLPEAVVEELNFQFICLTRTELLKYT